MITRILMGALLSVCLSGCALSKQDIMEVEIVDGCMIKIRGVESIKSSEMERGWTVGEKCNLKMNVDLESRNADTK